MRLVLALVGLAAALLAGCSREAPVGGAAGDARPATLAVNAGFAKEIDLDPAAGLVDAKRGFIARPSGKITAKDGTVLHDFDAYGFVAGAASAPTLIRPACGSNPRRPWVAMA